MNFSSTIPIDIKKVSRVNMDYAVILPIFLVIPPEDSLGICLCISPEIPPGNPLGLLSRILSSIFLGIPPGIVSGHPPSTTKDIFPGILPRISPQILLLTFWHLFWIFLLGSFQYIFLGFFPRNLLLIALEIILGVSLRILKIFLINFHHFFSSKVSSGIPSLMSRNFHTNP